MLKSNENTVNSEITIHKIVKVANSKEDLSILLDRNKKFSNEIHHQDKEKRTLLHIAVLNRKPIEILNYLVNELQINVEIMDNNDCTALHYACKEKYDEEFKEKYQLLKRNSISILTVKSKDDLTPLEIACGDIEKLKVIENIEKENLIKLLEQIDNVSQHLPDTNGLYIFSDKPKTEIWIKLLNRNANDLIYFLKKNINCKNKYYLSSNEFYEILLHCSDNGNGLLNYMKTRKYFDEKLQSEFTENLFSELTGFKNRNNSKITDNVYFNSVLFLVLITGRLELISPLLRFCQFNIILYGLLTCLICHKLAKFKVFPDEIKNSFRQIKDFCENYSIEVLNSISIKDLTLDKHIVFNFLTNTEQFTSKRILDIAFLGNCSKFLGLPACQKSLSEIWKKGNFCPAAKFYLNSIYHLMFLILFAYLLINQLYAKISIPELICYIYGFGYLIEILSHFVNCFKNNFFDDYIKDPINYLDISATIILLFTGILRYLLSKYFLIYNHNTSKHWKIIESTDGNLYLTRLCLCFSFVLYSMRVIYFGFIFKRLGPKLKMISRMMVKDLIPVIFVFLIFIISFGIAFECLLFPNSFINKNTDDILERKPVRQMIIDIFKRATLTIFDAHYCLEEITNRNNEHTLDRIRKMSVYFLFFAYIVIANVMIMNLLIAVFSNTVTVIIEKSRISWKAERYKHIHDYLEHSFLPPPFNIVEILYGFFKMACKSISDQIDCADEKYLLEFMSFKILQAFSLKNCRYKLLRTEEDKEREKEQEIRNIKDSIKTINESLKSITSILVKKGLLKEKRA